MGAIDLLFHLLNFVAPALVVAILVTIGARFIVSNKSVAPGFIAQAAINFIACSVVLLAGLWFFGRDGKMATYTAMVLVSASSQWVVGRGWKV